MEFPSELPVGDIVLSFQYTGVLNDQMRGFYSSKYTHPDHPGEDRYVAVTQFEVEYNSQDCQPYCNALWGEPVHGTMYRPMCSWFCFYPAARTAPSSLFSFVFPICLPSISLSSVDSAAMNVIAPTQTNMVVFKILYCGKLLREKTFVNLVVLCLFAKVFPAKFGAWHPLAWQK